MRVVIMGAPGAGKGTQAQRLTERLGVPHVSTGDILRQAVAAGTPVGLEAGRLMKQGRLLPDALMVEIVDQRLRAPDAARGFILDGFPRTVAQADALEALLARTGQRLDAVVHIAVSREELVERLAGRRVCPDCGAMFHLRFDPPATPARCDRCGAPLVQRDDDREATIRRRLDVYAEETAPVLQHYRAAGLLREVGGTGSRDEVFARLTASLR